MNQKQLWTVVALSTTALGIPSVAKAATPGGTATNSPSDLTGDAADVGSSQLKPGTLSKQAVKTEIHTHDLEGREAATLYVRGIPVLTFTGDRVTDNTHQNPINDTTPAQRANAVATQINQLIDDRIDANLITVSWKAGSKGDRYAIKVNGQELVEIDSNTRLPDTTNNLAQDALQATNRLRRVIGEAKPLSQIADIAAKPKMPETQQPQQNVSELQQAAKKPTGQTQRIAKPSQGMKKQSQQQVASQRVRSSTRGMASFYGYEGSSRTATGERFNPHGLTAAHRSLPFGTRVRVTNNNNGRSVVVRINDRGPFIRGRVIDVSVGAARVLGMINSGVASVTLEVLDN